MVPRAVLMKSGLVSVNTARQVNAAHSKTTVNDAKRPKRINTVKDKNINAARPKAVVNAARPKLVVNAVKENNGNPQMDLLDQGVIDSDLQEHITGTSPISQTMKETDEGIVAFEKPQRGKITKGKKKWVYLKKNSKNRIKTCLAEVRNRTLIEASRTMLADSKLPTTYWAEAVNIACYVQNRVLFGCPVTILNTIDHLAKFDGKADKGFFVGYSLNSKAFRVFNSRTRIVEENLHIRFSENTPNVVGSGTDWIFDIDALTIIMNYNPIVAEVNAVGGKTSIELLLDLNWPALEDISIFDLSRDNEDVGAKANMNNLDTTIQAKTVNGEVQLQGLVDGKKIIITESIVRRDLQPEDVEGVDCLPNATIFEQLTLIGALPTDPHHTPTIIQPSTSQPQKKQRSRKLKRKDTEIPQSSGPTDNVADEAVNEEMDDSLERAATTAIA
ncbi:ribonuclease H-like domain-containing protein [Tanacetum coccineum]